MNRKYQHSNSMTARQRIAIRRTLLRLRGYSYQRSTTGKRIRIRVGDDHWTLFPCADKAVWRYRQMRLDQFFKEIL